MTRQSINIGAAANDGTGDTLRAAGQKINENFVELYQLLGGDSDFPSTGVQITTTGIEFEGTTVNGTVTTLAVEDPTAARTITFPNATGTVLLAQTTQTLTNKTLVNPVIKLAEIVDDDSSHSYTIITGSLSADTNLNIPSLSDSDTLVVVDGTQTLTNKTLTAPTLTSPKVATAINDVNDAELIKLTATASAVNEITVANAATGNSPSISATGTDTNVGLLISPKGTGALVANGKFAVASETKTTSGSLGLNSPLSVINSGSATGFSLANGTVVGETKYIINRGAGTSTITPTSLAGSAGTIELTQNQTAIVMWGGSNWFVLSKQSNA